MWLKVARFTSTGLLIALTVWLWWTRDRITVTAQSGDIAWSEPVLLSGSGHLGNAPTIAADMAGNVHVMWSGSEPHRETGGAIFYTRWNGEGWSPPLDVLASESGVEFPELAVTSDGILHAVWGISGESKMMYAYAPACCADDARNWSEPVSLGTSVLAKTALVADDWGRVHAAFASQETKTIVYRRSDDGGATWPIWVEIFGGMRQDDEFPVYPRLAVDGRGRVHMVWSVLPWSGRLVMYARSDDGGDNWNEPQIVDSRSREDYEEGYGPIFIDVETRGEDEVHLIWDGAPTIERNHIWSSDGGRTWSEPSLLIPELTRVGRQGYNDMVVDSAGMLHAVALGAPYHASWSGGRWSDSTAIAQQPAAEHMRMALSLGNQLHVAWLNHESSEKRSVWYVHGKTIAPAIAPQALPRPSPTSVPVPTSTVTATAVSSPAAQSVAPTSPARPALDSPRPASPPGSQDTIASDPVGAILMSVIPSLLLVGIAVVVRIRQAR